MPMMRPFLSVALLLTLGLSAGWAQKESTAQPPAEERGTYLGVLFAPVPDIVYDQLPQLRRDRGVVISHVLPDSPATKAGLRHNDILLQYGDECGTEELTAVGGDHARDSRGEVATGESIARERRIV